jgi:nicotinate-nucleotide adenylyltransferase
VRLALFGGSFDPPHVGHLFIAEEARVNLGYDRILFVPAARPPHKQQDPAASAHQRIQMVQASLGERADFIVEPWEIEQGGTSYTIDTVRHVIESYGLAERPGLVIGDDLARDFRSWRNAEELAGMVDVVVADRTGSAYDDLVGQRHARIDNSVLAVSSSDIRKRVREGRAFRYLVPEPVYEYVNEYGLYR